MSSVALRGLLSRKLRTVLTMIAIVLGVSMISGTYVLTDTINSSFSTIFHQQDKKTDAVIRGKSAFTTQNRTIPPAFPQTLLARVKSIPGVAAAEGVIVDQAQIFDTSGNEIGPSQGAPSLLFSRASQRFSQVTVVKGREPHGREIALDQTTFDAHHLRLGQAIGVASAGRVIPFHLVGVTKFGSVGSLGGAKIISMDLAEAQQITGKVGKLDQISVASTAGVSRQQLVERLRAAIPSQLRGSIEVKTSTQFANDQTQQIGDALGVLTIALLAFAGLAVFVGAFIIFNTFSITVAQRAREFGLLRTLGATRRQILISVVLEALIVGLLASVTGLLFGLVIAKGLNALFKVIGVDLPSSGTVLLTRTVVVGLLVGVVVTLVSSIMPAVRATRVPPIAALREGAQLPAGRWSRYTPYIAAVLAALGVLMLVLGIFASISSTQSRLSLLGLGAVVLFLGVAMLSPKVVGPMASVLGWPIERLTSITGRLARENAVRNPSRTATTAAALMIGLAVVGFVTIFAAELRLTANDAVDRELAGTYGIYTDTTNPIPASIGSGVASVPGVSTVSAIAFDSARVDRFGEAQVNSVQPATFTRVYRFQWKNGSNSTLARMGSHDVFIDDTYAKDHSLSIDSTIRLKTPVGIHDTFTVRGIYKSAQFLPTMTVRNDTFARDWKQPKVNVILVQAASGQNIKALQARINRYLRANYPVVQAHSQQDLKDQNAKQVNQLLALIYVLLAMSVLVSLFGIINTLVLSIYERTREIGMLRAIGTTRTQIRWMIRWESVIVAVIGAVLGLLLGILLAVMVTAGLSSQGIEFTLPIGQLLIWVVFAMIFGIVAAAFPARRAARLDVLKAVAYE